jgi:glycine betaine/proline transport system permease protein
LADLDLEAPLAAPPGGGLVAAALGGPLWAAAWGRWGLFGLTAAADLAALVAFGFAATPKGGAPALLLGVALVALAHGATAVARFAAEPRAAPGPGVARRLALGAALLAGAGGLTLQGFFAAEPPPWLATFPAPKGLDVATAKAIDTGVEWMKRNWTGFFDTLTFGLRAALRVVETAFVDTPWPVTAAFAAFAAHRLSGLRAMLFTIGCLAYLGLFGFWAKSMETLALVATAVLICVAIGLPLGVLCAKSGRATAVIEPVLDVMQTLPTFVYLIPAVAFFSIGKPPGVIATVIFALPPIVRLTALGIRQTPADVREAADAFGATPAQMLLKVELPLAAASIRLGVNQTIMMCLSMVVVAAMIGAGGLGLDVIRSLQHLKTGQGFLAGLAIVLCAMALDRMLRGRERRPGEPPR